MSQARRPRILVVARGHLGDVISALPALRDLRAGFPGSRLTLVANDYVRGALEGCPYVDEIIYGFAYKPRKGWRGAVEKAGLLMRVAGRYDMFVSLRASPGFAPVLGWMSGAGVRAGYRPRGIRGRLLTHDLGYEPFSQPNRLTNAAVVKALGVKPDLGFPRLDWVSAAEQQQADRLLAEAGIDRDTRFAVFQISAHWGCYEWKSDKWAAVAGHLAARHQLKVVVVGTGEDFERQKFAEVARLTDVPVSLQGMTSLPMLFHVVSRAALVVAGDSALTQIALAQRAPSIILFGIEPEVRNGPLAEDAGQTEAVQHWEGPELAPTPNPHCLFGQSHCHTVNCVENSSFRLITVAEVCLRADRMVERGRVRAAILR